MPSVLFFCAMAKCGQHNASAWGAAPTCQHRELGNSAQRPGLRSTRVRVQMPRGFGPTRERQRLPAGGGCADGQTALPATRLYSGANDAVRCIGQRSALHRLSQHAARAHAARCVILTAYTSPMVSAAPACHHRNALKRRKTTFGAKKNAPRRQGFRTGEV